MDASPSLRVTQQDELVPAALGSAYLVLFWCLFGAYLVLNGNSSGSFLVLICLFSFIWPVACQGRSQPPKNRCLADSTTYDSDCDPGLLEPLSYHQSREK